MKMPVHIDQSDLEAVAGAYYDRVTVLEAAARAVVVATIRVVPQTHLDRDATGCWCCDRWLHLPDDTHDDDCPVGKLAALLGDEE